MRHKFQVTFDIPKEFDNQKLAQLESDLLEICDKIVSSYIWAENTSQDTTLAESTTNGLITEREEVEIS